MPFALLVLAHSGLWLLAIALQRRLPTGTRGGDVVAAAVVQAVVASVLALGLGLCGALTPAGMTVAGVAAGALGFGLGGAKAVAEAWRGGAGIWREMRSESAGITALVTILAAFLLIRHAANAWLFIPYTVDEHAYHLPRLVAWVQSGSVTRPAMLDTRGYFPAGMQLLQTWWVVIPHHDVIIEGASIEMALLGGAAVAVLARSLGATRGGASLAGLLWLCAPIVLVQASSAMNDLAAGALVLAAVAALVKPVNPRSALFHAGIALALGAGIKPTVLFVAPAVAILGVLAWKKMRSSEVAPESAAGFNKPFAGAVLGVAVLCGVWWYALNARDFGNPFFPVVPGVSGSSQKIGPMPVAMSGGPSLGKLAANVKEVFGARYVQFDSKINPTSHQRTGWGFAVALAGPVALAWLLFRERSWLVPAAVFGAGILTTLLVVEHDDFNSRFVLWAAALPAAALGVLVPRLPRSWVWVVLVIYAAGADLVRTSVPPVVRDDATLRAFLGLPWRQRDARYLVLISLVGVPGGPDEFLRWQDRYDENEPVMCLTAGWPVAALARGDYRRRLEFAAPRDGASLIAAMKKSGCRRLLYLPPELVRWDPPAETRAAVAQAVASGDLKPLHTGWFERVDR